MSGPPNTLYDGETFSLSFSFGPKGGQYLHDVCNIFVTPIMCRHLFVDIYVIEYSVTHINGKNLMLTQI